jgi:phage FluMu protein Com
MSLPKFMDIRCPVCSHLLFRAFGISAHLIIEIRCTCKRLVEIREGFTCDIIQSAPRRQEAREA